MMTDPLSQALDEASSKQPYVPDIGEAVRRGRRLQTKRRRITVGAATLATAAVVTVVLVALPGSSDQNASITPAPATSSTSASPTPSTSVTTATPTPPPASPRTPADPMLVQQVTNLPASLFAAIPPGTDIGGLPKIHGPALVADGKPVVFFDGAEYSPFSAAERWPLIIALSRFGTWSSLSTLTSSSTDVPANIATFSFYGASYTSPYLTFQSVETATNQPRGNIYEPLQTPSPDEAALINEYDHQGAVPFIDIGNSYGIVGSTYNYAVLQGKTPDQIAAALSDPTNVISKSVIGSANALTAAICDITGHQPVAVCNAPPLAGASG